jgi:uncharacterized protein YeaO (DUF488 family)
MIKLKRVYERAAPGDGTRVLVDRLWPRGLTKRAANVDLWLKDVAPSVPLRKWFGHRPDRWKEFAVRYRKELHKHKAALNELRKLAKKGRITLVYAAADTVHTHAQVLYKFLARHK